MTKCDQCGAELQVGDFPFCPHGRPARSKGFEAFYDHGLGQTITGFGDVNKACRPKWENDHIVHIQPRDRSEGYYRELSQRHEHRVEMERKNR